ncbi:hypothetical protein KSF73_08855 [Burkholderiaceae bacterium DAT-1]|nr:hypothetical protein [Burkholderiaceae bacterium DAT-1]
MKTRSPIPIALFIQATSLALAYVSVEDKALYLQPIIAVLLSSALKQPWWWRVIHATFFPLLLLMHIVPVPSWFWLVMFILSWFVFGGVHRNRVPLYLSSQRAVSALCEVLPMGAHVLDIGSGTGTVLIGLSRRPDLKLSGVEHAWGPWLLGQIRLRLGRIQARLDRKDMLAMDWRPFNVVYAFLSPAAMPDVWAKAERELSSGAWLVSNSFPVEGRPVDRVIEIGESEGARLYLWQMP